MNCTEMEREILEQWPTVTAEDLVQLNDLFPHYIFFRPGKESAELWYSCCGRHEIRPWLQRTEGPEDRALIDAMEHRRRHICPRCGRSVTMIDLRRAKGRKTLEKNELVVLLHAKGDALYADALVLNKDYSKDEDLTERPYYSLSSGYRFTNGEVMQTDHQTFSGKPCITWERGNLGKRKLVQEPFKYGSVSSYHHAPYIIINRDVLRDHSFYRYCGYFDRWQYRPLGPRGYAAYFDDLISYLTAYSIYPRQVEMLSKAEYWEPVRNLMFARKKNAAVMCWEKPDPLKSFDVDKRELAYIMSAHPPMRALEVRNFVKRSFGKKWSIPFCIEFCGQWGEACPPMSPLRLCRQYHLDPDRLLRYLGGTFERGHAVGYANAFAIYKDYLDAAYALGRCMEHGKVLWPEDLNEAHDRTTEELAKKQEAALKGASAAACRTRAEKYEFEFDGLCIRFPKTAALVRREGKMLKHCVGGYAQRHMTGTLTILFLRRTATPHVPLVTIEMQGNAIQQIHGWDDERTPCAENPRRESPRKLYAEFLDIWLRWLWAGSKRDHAGQPVLPRRRKKEEEKIA